MVTLKCLSALLIVLVCASFADAQLRNGFKHVVSHLKDYQNTDGGFRGDDSQSSAKATSDALLISSLYGLRSQINATDVPKFLASLANSDHGYGNVLGAKSDAEATRDVVVSYERLSVKTPNAANVANFLKSLLDKSSGLFADRAGERGSFRATAAALQTLELLGEMQQKWVEEALPAINDRLKSAQSANGLFYVNETGVTQIRGNYYAIVAGSISNYDFAASADALAAAIVALQSWRGQFQEEFGRSRTSVQATADGTISLYILDRVTGKNYVDAVNTATLRSALRYIPNDVTTAANAHVALAVTKALRESFQLSTFLQGSDPASDRVFEGTEVTPAVVISGHDAGVAHGGFNVDVATKFHGAADALKSKLKWDQESQRYLGDVLKTMGKFGPLSIFYTLSSLVPGLGKISFNINDTRHVGYGIVVVPKASLEHSGKEIREGEPVTIGTEFKFAVTLNTQSSNNLVTGDFVLAFTVEDSSHVVLHEEIIDGATNKKPLAFSYTLDSPNVPSGSISFRFEVAPKSGKFAHTSRTVTYPLTVAMVATNILFEGISKGAVPTYKVGDKVKVKFDAATFPDLRNVHSLPAKHAAARKFVLDVKTPQGVTVKTVEATDTQSGYAFEFPVEPKFDHLGPNVLSFRYKPKHGEEVVLQNFDSNLQELYDDSQQLSYAVKTDLSISDITEKPTTGELHYGNEIVFRFLVKDAVSGKNIWAGENSTANVYMELFHELDEAGTSRASFASISVPAESDGKEFVIRWPVNPNAHRGPGILSLTALDADNNKISLKNSPSLNVNIGGKIDVKSDTYVASPLDTTFGAFVVDLSLHCGQALLKDAQLRASVVHVDGRHEQQIATLPVSHHEGKYTVGWTLPHSQAKTGTYKLNFYREVDRAHAIDKRDARDKKARKERLLKGESDVVTTPESTNLEDLGLEPIFTVDIPYSVPRFNKLPIKAEFIALITFGSIVGWLIKKRATLR